MSNRYYSDVTKAMGCFAHNHSRKIIMELSSDKAMTFSEIMNSLGYGQDQRKSNTTAHHIRTLKSNRIISWDKNTKCYYLTKIGREALQVVLKFEEIWKEFHMSDLNNDGTVERFCIVTFRKKIK